MNGLFQLVLETSTPAASLARIGANGEVTERRFASDRSHNALLFAPLKELMLSHPQEKPSLVLVGSGPGSYSGTRVGIAAAQGVAIAVGCAAIAVPSILAVPAAENGAACLAIGDARRGSYWTAGIADFTMPNRPELTDADGLIHRVGTALAAGVAVFSFETSDRFPLPEELRSSIRLESPDALRLWRVWHSVGEDTRSRWAAEIPQPIYLKPPHITPAKRSWLVK